MGLDVLVFIWEERLNKTTTCNKKQACLAHGNRAIFVEVPSPFVVIMRKFRMLLITSHYRVVAIHHKTFGI